MKKNKTETAAARRFRGVHHMVLLSLLLLSLALMSYAWIRNYFDLSGHEVHTGKMLYSFDCYVKNRETGAITKLDKSYTTGADPEKNETVSNEAFSTPLDMEIGGENDEIFFVIEKLPGSIDLEASLKFDIVDINDPSKAEQFEYLSAISYRIAEEEYSEEYFTQVGQNNGTEKNLTQLLSDFQIAKLEGNDAYSVIRLQFDYAGEEIPQYIDLAFSLRIRLCVSQIGGSDNTGSTPVWRITNDSELVAAMAGYRQNETLLIEKNIEHLGDLVFVKPCQLQFTNGAKLTVTGNMMFSYKYDGHFSINTVSGGQLILLSANGMGGNLYIDTPYAYFDLNGRNDPVAGLADLYIAGDLTVHASAPPQNENLPDSNLYGIFFQLVRIGGASTELVVDPVTEEETRLIHLNEAQKPITVSGETRVEVKAQTAIGTLTATEECRRIVIVNEGTIAAIDLTDMTADYSFKQIDNIYIDSAGVVTDKLIRLPAWSYKQVDTGFDNPNTTIMATSGAGTLQAVVDGRDLSYGSPDNRFYSDGTGGQSGNRDDISYIGREALVEILDGNNKHILVHYELPTSATVSGFTDRLTYTKDGVEYHVGDSLATFFEYYSEYAQDPRVEKIAAIDALEEVTVICHGNSVLTPADYAFLQSLASVVRLDLSEASSEGRKVPDRALSGLAALTDVRLPDADTEWGSLIFDGCTSLQEIYFPSYLTRVQNNSYTGIHYIHTNSNLVAGLNIIDMSSDNNRANRVYYFVPAMAYETYAAAYTGGSDDQKRDRWRRYIFVDVEGMERYGNYFLKLNDDATCEFITYADWTTTAFDLSAAMASEYAFNLSTITVTVEGTQKTYAITSYADYALYKKLTAGTAQDVAFHEKLTHVGIRAFQEATTLRNVTLNTNGTLTVDDLGFYRCITGELTAPNLTALEGSRGFYESRMTRIVMNHLTSLRSEDCFRDCKNLTYVDLPNLKSLEGRRIFYGCSALVKAYMPKLTNVTWDQTANYGHAELMNGCGALRYLEISVIPYVKIANVDTNNIKRILHGISSSAIVVVREEYAESDAANYESGIAGDGCRLVMGTTYDNLYVSNTSYDNFFANTTKISGFDLSRLRPAYATVTSTNATEVVIEKTNTSKMSGVNYWFYINDDSMTAKLIAYTGSTINESYFSPPATFTDAQGTQYRVTSIEAAAYRYSTLTVTEELKMPEYVTYIGNGAFRGNNKKVFRCDLNQVTELGIAAMFEMQSALLYGEKLHTISQHTFYNNDLLAAAYLPNLRTRKVSGGEAFHECSNTRFLYVGASTSISYSSATASVVFINCEGVTGKVTLENGQNAILNQNMPGMFSGGWYAEGYYGGANFENVIFSDWVSYSVTVGEVTHQMEFPSYVFVASEISGGAYSGIQLLQAGRDAVIPADYVTPNELYGVSGTKTLPFSDDFGGVAYPNYTTQGSGTPAYVVTEIAAAAYQRRNLSLSSLTIGGHTQKIGNRAFMQRLSNLMGPLDLNNVTDVGYQCFYQASNITEIHAPKLQTVGGEAFLQCNKITSIHLPELVSFTGNSVFNSCAALAEVTIGKNATSLGSTPFVSCYALQTVTLLADEHITTVSNGFMQTWGYNQHYADKNNANNNYQHSTLKLIVPLTMLDEYEAKASPDCAHPDYTKCLWGVSWERVSTFGEATTDTNGTIFYWEIRSGNTAAITAVGGEFPERLVLPSSLSTGGVAYSVTVLTPAAVSSLNGVKTLVLPDQLQSLGFDASNLASSVASLEIVATNPYFTTEDGVLYNQNKTMLLVYPSAKTTASFVMPATVNGIAENAFNGAQFLEELTINSQVDIHGGAFANTKLLHTVRFTSTTGASRFLGRNIFTYNNIKIYVPASLLAAFRANVIFDSSILDMLEASPAQGA